MSLNDEINKIYGYMNRIKDSDMKVIIETIAEALKIIDTELKKSKKSST